MVVMTNLDQYLIRRNGFYYYQRRIPETFAELDTRRLSRASLKTTALEVARKRRDGMVEADELYWASLAEQDGRLTGLKTNPALTRYQAACKRALARGFVYTPVAELVDLSPIEELVARVQEITRHPQTEKAEAEAMLGTVKPTHISLSKAFELYCTQLAIDDQLSMSDEQKAGWKKAKKRAITNFTAICGDLAMDEIERKHAQEFRKWWGARVASKDPKKRVHPDTANRDLGNMRALYRAYWEHEGDIDRPNPFDKMRFNSAQHKDVPPFSDEWIKTKILVPGAFGKLNIEAMLIFLALVETGCRPSEIANLRQENIVLDHSVPHLSLKNRDDRKLKSRSSVRKIPLLGVSLEALKRAPNGFPKYRDRSASLSATLLKSFRVNGLFPSDDHRIYSIRHSFENRMKEAEIDYELRCILMGHRTGRPYYGSGGTLKFRHDQLKKIIHPFSAELF